MIASPQTSLRSYFFLSVFVTRILPRTSIRRTAPQHQILFPPWEAFPQSRVLNRVQFPPNRDFSKITRRRRPRRNEGGGGKEREREREKGTTGTLFTSYGGNSELGHVRPVESLELYVLLVSLLIALPRRNSETFLLWAACTERFCVNEFQRGKIRVPRGWWCRLVSESIELPAEATPRDTNSRIPCRHPLKTPSLGLGGEERSASPLFASPSILHRQRSIRHHPFSLPRPLDALPLDEKDFECGKRDRGKGESRLRGSDRNGGGGKRGLGESDAKRAEHNGPPRRFGNVGTEGILNGRRMRSPSIPWTGGIVGTMHPGKRMLTC